jgi:hypothetical protein
MLYDKLLELTLFCRGFRINVKRDNSGSAGNKPYLHELAGIISLRL